MSFRHSALTEKSHILSESVLKDYAGWTMSSKMTQIYIHLSGESSKILLQKKCVIKKSDIGETIVFKIKAMPEIAMKSTDLILNFVVNVELYYL